MPLYLHRIQPGGAQTGLWKLDESVAFLRERCVLSGPEEAVYGTFRHEARKRQWLGVRLLMQEMFTNAQFQIGYDRQEKPFIENSDWKISISHSRNLAAVMLHPKQPCGIDIEHMHARIEKVAEKFLCDEEIRFLGEKQFTEKLHVCWGIKESLYKMAGWPGMIFAEDMQIKPFEFSEKGTAEACIRKGKKEEWHQLHFETVEDYILVTTIKK